jgi:hypothetical protein
MEFFEILNARLPRDEHKLERLCSNFDMDCVDLDHEACWRGEAGIMPCCGRAVEFEKVRGICPFLWLRDH